MPKKEKGEIERARESEAKEPDLVRKPTAEEQLAELLDYLAIEASEIGRGEFLLTAAADVADARREAIEAIERWNELDAKSRSVSALRRFVERMPRPAPRPALSKRSRPKVPESALPELAQDEMRPFFEGNNRAAQAIVAALPKRRNQWAKFFAVRGCLHCHQRNVDHVANGLCSKCYASISTTLREVRGLSREDLASSAYQRKFERLRRKEQKS